MASSDYIPALIPEDARPTPVKKLSGRELLQQTSINSILPTHDAFSVRGEESILVALQTLTVKHILALPVFDSRTRQYTSFIDMFDISNFVTDKYAEVTPSELAAHTCSELADISTRNPYRAVEERASLDAALQLIIGGKLHRLAVLDAEGRFNNILSQSALVRFISDHISAFPFAERRVGELQLGYREVVTVRDTVTAHEAFAVIKASKVSAVPVLNADGVMVEVLSISDQRILLQQSTPDNPLPLSLLNLNVVEYLSHRVYASEALRVARGLVVVTPAATVEEVLFKIVATRVHRAYVVHELKPVGVIALYDILKLASEAK